MRRPLTGLPVFLLLAGLLGGVWHAEAQVILRGTVYNVYKTRPLDAVSVVSTSGRGTLTDSNGHYMIEVGEKDSISFSYLGRSTIKYPVININYINGFDIALHVNPTELAEIKIAPRNYHMDSIRNRQEYARVFEYQKPGLSLSNSNSGSGVGVDLNELINVFRFNRNRRMLAFQRRLVEEEHDKYIDHRFNRSITKKITHLEGDALDSFLVRYRPSYEFTSNSSDYEFFTYIKLAANQFKAAQRKRGEMKKED